MDKLPIEICHQKIGHSTNKTIQIGTRQIPGTVHTDLLQNKIIPDPFLETMKKQLQWIENENWEYETHFKISKSELKIKISIWNLKV
jgi:beta-galactosidase/beta-glucuronidase